MSIDVPTLAQAIRDHDDICNQMAIPECATAIAAEYARLVPAEDEPQLVKVPDLGDNPSYFVKDRTPVPAEDEGRLREAAKALVKGAEHDDDFEGEYVNWLVSAESFEALRDALDATPETKP